MAAKDDEKKALWVSWTRDVLGRYSVPDDLEDTEDALIDDMADIAVGYADAMLEEYEARFSGGVARRRGKRKKPDPDDDDDDD